MKKKSTRYKNGGTSKNEWISDKISKMLSEGKNIDQSTAIANAMYNSGDNQYQNGSTFIKPTPGGGINPNLMTRHDSLDIQRYSMKANQDRLNRGFVLQSQEVGSYPEIHDLNLQKLQEIRDKQKKNIPTQVINEKGYREPQIYDPNVYQQNIDNNKYNNQETDIGVLDPRAAYLMFDRRATPTQKSVWMNPDTGDGATTYGYDFGEAYKPKPRLGTPIKRPPGYKPKSSLTALSRPIDNMQNGGVPQYQYAGQNFNVPEPTYYDQNKTMFQTGQPMYSGQYSPPQPSSLGNESDMYQYGDNNLDGITNAQDNADKFGNSVNTYLAEDQYNKTRFVNPYGGFDIPSAAVKLGQGLNSGNGFDIATGGLKLLTGIGRNIASGAGQENRREWVLNDYGNKVRQGSRPMAEYAQNGGYFQDGGMQMGQQAPPQEQQDPTQMIAQALQQGADPQEIVAQLINSGVTEQEAVQMVQGIMKQMQGQQEQYQEQQAMQMGGQLKKKVIGEHEIENTEGKKIAELEGGEQFKTPNGEIREVIGKPHSQGGVKLTEEQLPNGSEIISDHLKVGKSGAKKFNDDYDLGIKSTDTYATILDKFNKKSGIKKIVDEQEIAQKNIEKQVLKLQENPAAESTIKLNLQLFTDQFQELQDQKTPLEEARKVLFDEVFQPQEESKEQGEHNYLEAQKPIPYLADEEYKNGGEKNSLWKNIRENRGSGKAPTKQMLEQEAKIKKGQMGGSYNDGMIMEYSQKHNLHPDRVRELMQMHQNGGLQQYQNAGFRVSNNTNVNSKNKRDKQSPNKEAYGITQSEQALQQLYNNFPDIINSDTAFKQFVDVGQDGKLKFKGGVPLNKQVAIVGNAQRMMNTRMSDSANTIINNPTQFSEDAVKEAERYAQDETFLANADTFTQDPTKSIRGYDSKLGDFTSGRYSMQMNLVTPEERKMLNDAGVTTMRQLKNSPLRQKLSADSLANVDKVDGLIGDTNADYGIAEITPEKKALETTPTNQPTAKTDGYTASGGNGKTRYALANLPDQSPLMPDSLQGALKMNHRYDRVETPFVSPDAQITEIRRQEQSAMQGLQGLPDAQRASAIAQIQANSQNALNQAIAQSQGANQSAKFNTDVSNANTQRAEEDMRNNDLQNYENKILTADAKTQRDLRNYYNVNQKVNLTNFNAINGLNLVNDRFDNAQYDGQGMNMENLQKARNYDDFIANNTDYNNYLENKKKIGVLNKANKKIEKGKARFGGKK